MITYNLCYDGAPAYPVAPTGMMAARMQGLPPFAPIREGYSFEGWYKDAGLTERFKIFASENKNYDGELFAKWGPAVTDYTATYKMAREIMLHYTAYDLDSYQYLFASMAELEFTKSLKFGLEQAANPDEHWRTLFEQNRAALAEVIAIGDSTDKIYDIWCDGPMPVMPDDFTLLEESLEGVYPPMQACLQDDPGFRPFLLDMRLPDPASAKGTAILSPSIRGGMSEGMKTACELNRRGYNAFVVEPRFNRFSRDGREFNFTSKYCLEILDVQRAIRFVKYNAEKFEIDPKKLISVGFSKGNCIHRVSSFLFDLTPDQVPFYFDGEAGLGTNGEAAYAVGHENDAIDMIPADVSVNTVVYGGRVLAPTAAHDAVTASRIYSKENLEKGFLYPGVIYGVGNYDEVTFAMLASFDENNKNPDKLYDIPWEAHVFDKVPHGIGSGTQFENFGKFWDAADVFYQTNLGRSVEGMKYERVY